MNLKIANDVVWNALDDEIVILNLASGVYFSVGGVGRRFWELLAQGVSADAAIPELIAEFDVDADRLKTDLDSLIGQLRSEGLVALAE